MTRDVVSVGRETPYREIVDLPPVGRLQFRSTADDLVRLSRQVPGVVAVTDDLRSDVDDGFLTGSTLRAPFGVA